MAHQVLSTVAACTSSTGPLAQTRVSSRTNRVPSSPHTITPFSLFTHKFQLQRAEKEKDVRQWMSKFPEYSLEELEMIDAIQRLGIDHLFQQEIREALQRQYMELCYRTRNGNHQCSHDQLHEVALRFRLLRQHGYNVSSDLVFGSFKGGDGKFEQGLGKDTQRLMSLFEASQMGMRGEDTLDEANTFCVELLEASLENVDESHTRNEFQTVLARTLKHPHHKSLARFTANNLLHELENKEGWRNELAELARLEFEMNQILYHNEITHVLKWWKELGLAKELKFARDQPLKWYMWPLAALPDPSLSEQRTELTKPISLIYLVDDIYDVYGTPEDLSLFTEAIKRWEFDSLRKLPDYMKICLKALFNTTSEIAQRIWIKYGWNPHDSLKKAWAELAHAFLEESKWLTSDSLPTSEEYLNIAKITSGIPLVLTHMFFLMGEGIDNNSLQVLSKDYHGIISSIATILRLWDDLGSAKDEDQNGRDGCYITCYMNEKTCISMDEAREHAARMISDEWKHLNKCCLLLPQYPFSSAYTFTRGCLNVARTIPLMYSYDESHNLPNLEKLIHLLLYQSMSS